MNLHEIPIGDGAPHVVNVIIEIPEGSTNKYEYDPRFGTFRLDRTLYSPLYYPHNYGFIPSTLYPDGDPLDIFVLCSHSIVTGALVQARPVGILRMHDDKGQDDKVISVFNNDPRYAHVQRLTDISEHQRKELVHFFQVYKDLENKFVEIEGWFPVTVAHDLIMRYVVER